MKRPVIFFDWDGTLADSMALCVAEIRAALERMGLPPLPESRLMACNGPTYAESVDILGIPRDRAEEYLRLRMEAELELVPTVQRLFPGVQEMLERLQPWADLAIVSNGMPRYLELSLRTLGIQERFAMVQALIPGKTKAEALAQVLQAMRPERAVMVGDRAGDFSAAHSNGLTAIAACYGYGTPMEWAQADCQAQTVAALEDLLRTAAMNPEGATLWTPA